MAAADQSIQVLNPVANFGPVLLPDMVVRSGGSYLYTDSGRKILDWTSGQMCCVLGHCHPELVETMCSVYKTQDHLASCMLSPPVVDLATRLTSALPAGLEKVVFYSTGSESNEAAIRLAKTYTGKFEVVALANSWHGMTGQSLAAQYIVGRKGVGPTMPGQFMLPQPNAYRSIFRHDDGSHDWETELTHGWKMIDQSSCGSLAACIVECIQGDAGANMLPPGYLKALKRHCELRGMLLIVDEAQTGLGRTGDMFAIDSEDVVPDVLTLSKPLANGLPLSAMITSSFLDAECKKKGFLFTSTHVNDPLIAAVGKKTLEIIMRDSLAANARERGEQLLVGLRELQSRHQCIGDVRGRGLMAGLEIVGDRSSKANDPELAVRLAKALWDSGIWCQMTNKAFVRIGPPINCTSDQVVEGLGLLEKAFSSAEQ